jgi:hypothetical protein
LTWRSKRISVLMFDVVVEMDFRLMFDEAVEMDFRFDV